MSWIVDGWVTCPACGGGLDAAAVFGETNEERWALATGLEGECDLCGVTIVVKLFAKQPGIPS